MGKAVDRVPKDRGAAMRLGGDGGRPARGHDRYRAQGRSFAVPACMAERAVAALLPVGPQGLLPEAPAGWAERWAAAFSRWAA